MIELRDLTDRIVTADALHCHARMAVAIRARGGDYAPALKGNQMALMRQAEALLDAADHPQAETFERAHGRLEHRRAEVAPAGQLAGRLDGLRALARITTTRDGVIHTRLYALSRLMSPDEALRITRAHWGVENQLHRVLDVALGEDLNRARKDSAPSNIALLNRIALNALNAIDDPKASVRTRIKKAAWEDNYLLKALAHMR